MVLEAIGAFALACNILQVVEYGVKIATKAGGLHHADTGDTSEIDDLEKITQQLNKLNKDLGNSIVSDPASLSPLESRLTECNAESLRLSQNFIDFLTKLRPKKSNSLSNPSWAASFRSEIRRRWHQDDIVAMERNLSQAKSNLIMAFLLNMFTKSQDAMTMASNHSEKNLLAAISEISNRLRGEISDLTQHMSRLKVDESTHEALLSNFQDKHADAISRLSLKIETILLEQEAISIADDERHREKAQRRICKSLSFESMSSRTDQIREAEYGTYDWILVDQNTGTTGLGGFQEWLNSTDPVQNIFWILGKPGAGKSTLMRYLQLRLKSSSDKYIRMHSYESNLNKRFCDQWLSGQNLFVCSFFLWNPGHRLQKSLRGLLRSILHQCFSAHLWSIEIVISEEKWSMAKSVDPGEFGIEWSLTELKQAVESCLDRLCMTRKVLLLLDGLDELDGTDEEREELLKFLQRLNHLKNLKMCTSSRPWNIFGDFFRTAPKLQIQDFTRPDIEEFVRKNLSSDMYQQSKYLHNGGEGKGLIEVITDKASGVFLWVRLVVQELLRGFRDGETIRTLREKVDSMPPDLDGFFRRMIDSIDPPYRQEGSAFLQTALFGLGNALEDGPHGLLEYTFLEYKDPEFIAKSGYDFTELDFNDIDAFEYRIDLGKRRLNSRCMGLLESIDGTPYLEGLTDTRTRRLLSTSVSFLHRSLMEFLLKADSQTLLQQLTKGPFPACTFLCSALLAEIVAIAAKLSSGSDRDAPPNFWIHVFSKKLDNFLKLLALSEGHSQLVTKVSMANIRLALRFLLDPLCSIYENRFPNPIARLSRFKDSDDLPIRIAIEYGITYYVKAYLAENHVEEDYLLGLLDQALNPSVKGYGVYPSLIRLILEAGADPNRVSPEIRSIQVRRMKEGRARVIWEQYVERLVGSKEDTSPNDVEVIEMMVNYGAKIHSIRIMDSFGRHFTTLRQCLEKFRMRESDRDRLEAVIRTAEKAQAPTPVEAEDADLEQNGQLINGKRKQDDNTSLDSKRQKC